MYIAFLVQFTFCKDIVNVPRDDNPKRAGELARVFCPSGFVNGHGRVSPCAKGKLFQTSCFQSSEGSAWRRYFSCRLSLVFGPPPVNRRFPKRCTVLFLWNGAFQCCQCGSVASWQLAMFPFTSHCLPMSFLVNRLKVVAVEVLDAVEELKFRTGQPLPRFEL